MPARGGHLFFSSFPDLFSWPVSFSGRKELMNPGLGPDGNLQIEFACPKINYISWNSPQFNKVGVLLPHGPQALLNVWYFNGSGGPPHPKKLKFNEIHGKSMKVVEVIGIQWDLIKCK